MKVCADLYICINAVLYNFCSQHRREERGICVFPQIRMKIFFFFFKLSINKLQLGAKKEAEFHYERD